MPAIGLETLLNIFSERDGSITINGNLVIVVQSNKLSELPVTFKGNQRGLRQSSVLCEIEVMQTYPAREAASEETPS